MELDELKMLINARLEEGIHAQNTATLEAAVRQKTRSVTSKIKKSIAFEFAAFVLCIIVAIVCWLVYPSVLVRLFCVAVWIFCLVFSAYLYPLYRKIIFYESVPGTVKENLQQLIVIISRFTSLYFRISMGLLPVIYVFGLIIGYLDVSKQGLLEQFHLSKQMLVYGVIFIACWSIIIYFLSKWYIRKLYGNHLLQLQQQLKDIENG
jgi:hypothetical protein